VKNREKKYFLMVLPGLAGMIAVYGLPYLKMFLTSLQESASQRVFVGLRNYAELFQNRAFLRALGNTAVICVLGTALILPLSILLALLLLRSGRLQSFLRTSFILPFFVPAACVVMVWRVLFDQNGAINSLLRQLGGSGADWLGSGWSKLAVLLMYLWRNIGLNVVLFTGAMAGLPTERVDVARIEGAGRVQVFFLVTLRHLAPAVVFAAVLSVMNSFKVFREIYLLTGDYPPESMYLLGHFLNNMLRQMNYPRMSAGAIVYTLFAAGLMSVLYFLEKRAGKDET
jgi:multiple sugar transport system permease protein